MWIFVSQFTSQVLVSSLENLQKTYCWLKTKTIIKSVEHGKVWGYERGNVTRRGKSMKDRWPKTNDQRQMTKDRWPKTNDQRQMTKDRWPKTNNQRQMDKQWSTKYYTEN
jgi:hypothetical protein